MAIFNETNECQILFINHQIKLDRESDKKLFSNLAEELERIEGAIDPYSDPDLQEQWSLCIGNIMRHQDDSAGRANSAGKFSVGQSEPESWQSSCTGRDE